MKNLIHYRREDSLALIGLTSAPVNALGQALREQLLEACERAAADASVKAIVLHGEGLVFSAGADISEFGSAASFARPDLSSLLVRLTELDKPLIAAIGGLALGAGWNSPWPAATAWRRPGHAWAYRKSSSACCPAPVAPSGCRV